MALKVKTIGTATGSAGTGTVTAAASTSVIGVGTLFTTEMKDGSGNPLTMTVSGTLYNVASITDDTHLTLTTSTTFTAAAYTRGSRNYSTISAFIASLPANLVTDGNSYEGDCYNDSQFLEINTAFSGHTTDATHTILLTTGAGQSFQDNANVQTNALRYNQSNGVGVKNNGGYGAGYVLIVNDLNTTISKLQINNTIGRGLQGSAASTVSSCIIDSVSFPGVNGATWLNCLLTSTGDSNCLAGAAPSTLVNCTLVKTTDSASTQNAFTSGYGAAYVTKNVAIFGFNGVVASATVTATTCMTDVASPPSGFTGSKTYANQFVNTGTTLGNRDFRAKAGGDILNAGTTDTTDIPAANDIALTSRPQGSAWDIGAWELVVASSTVNSGFFLAAMR